MLAQSLVAAFALFAISAQAENLFSNPGFETGDVSGWNHLSTVVSSSPLYHTEGVYGALLLPNSGSSTPAILSQFVPTAAGKSYVLIFDDLPSGAGTCTLQVTGTNLSLSQMLPSNADGTFQHAVVSFVADSASTNVSLSVNALVGATQLAVDNFTCVEATYSRPGRFSGNVKRTTSVPSESLSSSHTETLVARIDANGRIYIIVQPNGTMVEGYITDDMTAVLGGLHATATSVGSTIKLILEETRAALSAENPSSQPTTVKSTWLLHRTGN